MREVDLSQLHKLTFWEKVLVEEALTYDGRLGQDSNLLKERATPDVLHDYATLFCRMLGSILDNLQAGEPIFLDGLLCQFFYFGNKPAIEWLGPDCENHLTTLLGDDARESQRASGTVRLYHENVILIFKSDPLRDWMRSTAIRDADETLRDLLQQG